MTRFGIYVYVENHGDFTIAVPRCNGKNKERICKKFLLMGRPLSDTPLWEREGA